MSQILLGLLSVLVATNQPAAVSNLVVQTTGVSIRVPNADDPVEQELRRVMAEDEKAQDEVDGWIQENSKFGDQGAAINPASLAARIQQRLDQVKKLYEDFLLKHPEHARARLAYASFLGDIGEETASREHTEKARDLDPSNPATWNNLGNLYGHRGPVKEAFVCYEKAISLNPSEATYYQNLATTVYLFRKDAKEHYGIDEQEVFTKALALYEKALKLDPKNFILASDWAQSYYGIKPPRNEDALKAWNYALEIARDDIEQQGVHIHLARFNINMQRFDEARTHLARVEHEMYQPLKERVAENLKRREEQAINPGTEVSRDPSAGKQDTSK